MKRLFILILLCAPCTASHAQTINYDSLYKAYNIVYYPVPTAYGYGLVLPFDTSKLFYTKYAPGAIAYQGGYVFYCNNSGWQKLGNGGNYYTGAYLKTVSDTFYADTTAGKLATQSMLKSDTLRIDSIFATKEALKDTAALRVRYIDSGTVYYTKYDVDTAKLNIRGLIPLEIHDTANVIYSNVGINLADTAAVLWARTLAQGYGVGTIKALTGDVSASGTGTVSATLKNTGTAGTYGSATQIPVFTTDYAGRITGVTNTTISAGTVTSVAATGGTGITVAGSPITGSGTLTVTATGGLTAGTGISLAGSFPTYTVTNSSPSSGGTVTSLLVKSNAAAYSVTPTTPITSSGTFSIVPTGLSSQFVKGDGSLDGTTYGSGTVTSVGVVQGTNMYVTGTSPITTSGTFTFTPSQNPVDSSVTFASQTLTTDVLPASGSGKLFSTNQTGTEQPQWNPSVVTPYLMQGALSDHQFSKLYPNLGGTQLVADGPDFLYNDGNSNLFPAIGATALVNAVYDATNRLPNVFNESTTSSALANSSAGWYYASTSKSNGVFIQNTNYYGGAILTITFGLSSYFSTQRLFIGYDTSNNLQPSATTDPSAILNSVGLGKDVGDATLQFITNGRSGTATKINTGVTPTTGNEYRLTITINPNPATNGIYMTLETLTKSALPTKVSSGKLTSNIPVNGVALQPVIWANTGSGTSAVVLNFILMTQERL